jgi:integrase
MAVVQECPICKKYLSLKRKSCTCGADLDKLRRQKNKIRYWIQYRLPGGKQRKEFVGYSVDDAKTADGKRRTQKKEGRIFDMLPESKITFQELTSWYLDQPKKKKLAYYDVLKIYLSSFNTFFGDMAVNAIKKNDLENYQIQRKEQGKSDSYIDQEIGAARGMVKDAWNNDKVSGDALKPFKRVSKLLKRGANSRDRVLSMDEFKALIDALPYHARNVFIAGFFTGMRMGEITSLTWDQISLKDRRIELYPEQTKDREKRIIPMPETLFKVLVDIPRAIHDNHVFLYKGKPLKSIRASLKAACEKVGIPYGRNAKDGITPHDLRHTFNTYMRKAGAHDTITMGITGHSTREMFDRYNTVDEEEKAAAIKRMESFLFSQENDSQKKG